MTDGREVLYEELRKKIDLLSDEWDLTTWDVIAALTLLQHVYTTDVIKDAEDDEGRGF